MPGSIAAGSGLSGYAIGGSSNSAMSSGDHAQGDIDGGWSLGKLKRSYLDYLGTKREEIEEQQDARRFRHGSQYTSEEIRQLNLRKQPVVTDNRISRKIHGVVGTLARLKQDPKAYPRTPEHEEGAELATATIRYSLDATEWDARDPVCAEYAAVDGYGGVELNLVPGDKGDPEIELEVVNPDSFFYDPRSYKHDFSDARYVGVGKWLELDEAIDLFPDHEEELRDSLESGSDLTSEPDREFKWFLTDGEVNRIRVVEEWYKKGKKWFWCIYTGNMKLDEGESYLIDEKGNPECKYLMFSAYVDQDGDRYGFPRDMKPLQREINMRRSKALYTMLSRRIIAERGAFDDIEQARREAARSDGVVIRNKGFEAGFDDSARMAETQAQFQFLEDAKSALESIGPNVAVTGEGLEQSSGRAIHLLQQAGLADLGPYIQSYRGWKIRVYRAIWNAIQHHWTGERWIRVTDDDDISQFIQVNGVEVDPMTGFPTLVNALGSLDVDIIIDEGPDTVNQMADAYDTLTILAGKGTEIPPDVLIELSPLPVSVKQRLLDKMNPEPTPEMQQMQQLEMRGAAAEVQETEASAGLKQAQAIKAMSEANQPPDMPEQQDPRIVNMETLEKMGKAQASFAQADKTRMETAKVAQDIALEPERMMAERANAERNAEISEMKARQQPRAA
jgi:hypothetical protein